MYQRYSELRGWKIEPLESSPSEVGGFKEVTIKVKGDEVFRILKYESGVHRVQRVPDTETQGRIHTSTATVAVMPEAEDVDVELKPDELNIQATRSGGPGGQHVNTTDSCIQVTHIPTGIMVRCQDGRSQTKNKEKALTILRSKLLEAKQREEAAKYSEKGGVRIQMLKQELVKSISKLPKDMSFQVIYYSTAPWLGGESLYTSPTRFPDRAEDRIPWSKATKEGIASAVNNIKSANPEGATIWRDPLELAFAMRPVPVVVWLLSDGEAQDAEEVVNKMEQINPSKIPINTIGMEIE